MFNVEKNLVMKKMKYNQPKTEIFDVRIENVMLTVSNGGNPPDEGPAHAPARKGDIIP